MTLSSQIFLFFHFIFLRCSFSLLPRHPLRVVFKGNVQEALNGAGVTKIFQVVFLFKALFIILRWYLSLSQFLTSVRGTFPEAALYVLSYQTECGDK